MLEDRDDSFDGVGVGHGDIIGDMDFAFVVNRDGNLDVDGDMDCLLDGEGDRVAPHVGNGNVDDLLNVHWVGLLDLDFIRNLVFFPDFVGGRNFLDDGDGVWLVDMNWVPFDLFIRNFDVDGDWNLAGHVVGNFDPLLDSVGDGLVDQFLDGDADSLDDGDGVSDVLGEGDFLVYVDSAKNSSVEVSSHHGSRQGRQNAQLK